jgi:hypothetical protein
MLLGVIILVVILTLRHRQQESGVSSVVEGLTKILESENTKRFKPHC